MAYPTAPQQPVGFAPQSQHIAVNIQVNHQQPPVVIEPRQSGSSKGFLGRMVEKITQSQRYQKASAFTETQYKSFKEWAIDFASAARILTKETWNGVKCGALIGLAGGAVGTFLCPPLIGTAFTVSITAGITTGLIFGYLNGSVKASDYWTEARAARNQAQEATVPQTIAQEQPGNPFLLQETQTP